MDKIRFMIAKEQHLDEMFLIFTKAIDKMNENNIFQWDEVYPDKSTLYQDIRNRQLHIGIIGEEIVSAYVLNQECDEQYALGNWKYPNSSYRIIHRLCVNPQFQNKGIGTITMKYLENEVKKKGIETIRLDSYTLNPYAVRMYEKLGYEKVGFADFRKGKFYLMEKRLG
jgi:ribosomal protein S18 acetylase RimI-like enzyme